MLGRNHRLTTVRVLFSFLMTVVLVWGLVGCGDRSKSATSPNTNGTKIQQRGSLSEVAPPLVIQQLGQSLDAYQPQVTIVSPRADEVLQDTTVSVKFQVQDLPIFKDPDLGMGPHLQVILDNQPYKAVYDLEQPLVFEDLPPGTHTLRVFASRPWHESFKNEGAYAQTIFHILTKSSDHNPDPTLPLLTYSSPTGSYGAEPIMLDFYLTNAPLHLVAQENPEDEIADWRIRVTVNGENFVLDHWQPIYLKGFNPGKNWVQLEFLDEQGNSFKNVFNDTVRLIDYEPKGKDTLSKLVRGELSAEAARGIVNPNYKVEPSPTVTPTPSPSPTPSPIETPEPTPSVTPSVEETPLEATPTPEAEVTPTSTKDTQKPKSGGFFGRFRRPVEAPSASPEVVVPSEPEQTPEPEASTTPSELAPVEEPTPEAQSQPTPVIKPVPVPIEPEKPRFGGFLNRFRQPAQAPSPSPNLSEELETPSPEAVVPPKPEQTPEPETSTTPSELAPVEKPTPVIKPVPVPIEPEKPRFGGFLNRFRQPAQAPSPSPNLSEELETPSPEAVVPPKPEQTPEPNVLPTPSVNNSQKSLQPPTSGETSSDSDSGLPPTLPEIIETPFPQPSQPEAGIPKPESNSSLTIPLDTAPVPELLTEKQPPASSSETPEIPNLDSATAKPKLDLKEVIISPPAPTPSPRIIRAPANAELDIPARFLKKSVPDTPKESETLEKAAN